LHFPPLFGHHRPRARSNSVRVALRDRVESVICVSFFCLAILSLGSGPILLRNLVCRYYVLCVPSSIRRRLSCTPMRHIPKRRGLPHSPSSLTVPLIPNPSEIQLKVPAARARIRNGCAPACSNYRLEIDNLGTFVTEQGNLSRTIRCTKLC
jgi:hypothetical protein